MRGEDRRWWMVGAGAALCMMGVACSADTDPADEALGLAPRAAADHAAVTAAPFAETDDLSFGVAGDARFAAVAQRLRRMETSLAGLAADTEDACVDELALAIGRRRRRHRMTKRR